MLVRRRTTSSMIVRHRTTVIRSPYDIVEVARPSRDFNLYDNVSFSPRTHSEVVCYHTTIVRLSYDVVRFTYDLASNQAIIVKSYVIVRLSFDCRTMLNDIPTIAQTLPMRRKPIVFSVTTQLRLQYRSRIEENLENLRCHLSHVVAWCDQCFTSRSKRATSHCAPVWLKA